jgi:hypothetical protein
MPGLASPKKRASLTSTGETPASGRFSRVRKEPT